jgi:hypothetical protein
MPSFVKLLVGHFDTLAASAQLVVSVTGRQRQQLMPGPPPTIIMCLRSTLQRHLGPLAHPTRM